METAVRNLFARYQRFFDHALDGVVDLDQGASFYASAFIAASPAGVVAGTNDDRLGQLMEQGYERYRAMGTKEMRIRDVRLSAMDDHHCSAQVAWTAVYSRQNSPDVSIDFHIHYFVQTLSGEPKIFGWVSGDEQALLKGHGIV